MDRREFLRLLSSTPALPYLNSEPPPVPCGLCGSPAVFDSILDMNVCPTCGARETGKGWEK